MLRYKLMLKNAAPWIIILGLTAGNAVAWYQFGKMQVHREQSEAYNICIKANRELNGASEKACGAAQDRTNTEFICGEYSCWLEVK